MFGRLACALLLLTLAGLAPAGAEPVTSAPRLPQFTHRDPAHWINSTPLGRDDLLGQVVLVDVWTFGCWNCYRSFPWLRELEARLHGQDFRVVGIHSPEFEHERDVERVRAKVREFELTHPVLVDDDRAYWQALGNRYWPAFYLVDRAGRVRDVFVGETHVGDAQAQRIEARIAKLLAE